jgi:hypothetical protein
MAIVNFLVTLIIVTRFTVGTSGLFTERFRSFAKKLTLAKIGGVRHQAAL